MQAPPTHYSVTICGETYDIFANRFEQNEENLPGIGSFHANFEEAVTALTKSNVLRPPPENYVYGQNPTDNYLSSHKALPLPNRDEYHHRHSHFQ